METRHLLEDGTELPCDLFLGVPKLRAPRGGPCERDGRGRYIPVDPRTLETRFQAFIRLETSQR
jgi:sulfide:quinone oxidoreductase